MISLVHTALYTFPSYRYMQYLQNDYITKTTVFYFNKSAVNYIYLRPFDE